MSVWTPMTQNIPAPPDVRGLSTAEAVAFRGCWQALIKHQSSNKKRVEYYQMHNTLKDLGIAIPTKLLLVETVVGWPAKAVDALAVRSRFDGYVFEGDIDTWLPQILRDNDFYNLYYQATVSELMAGCVFATLSVGALDEPEVLITMHSARSAAGVWDYRKKRIGAGIVIVATDEKNKNPTAINFYTDDAVIEIEMTKWGGWKATRKPHRLRRPLMEPLVFRPSLERPFGKSRISRAVMALTDSAVRAALRSEVASEFITAPQKYLMGIDDDLLDDIKGKQWDAYIGSIFAVSTNSEDTKPTFGQLSQGTMQPHIDYMRNLAARFASETSIPVSSLGVIQDNPSSAEAIYAAKEDLIIEADALNATNGNSLRNIGLMTLAISQNKSVEELSDAEKTLMAKFKPADRPSIVSQADAMVKQVTAIPWIGETTVALEALGYTADQIARMKSEKTAAVAEGLIRSIAQGQHQQAPQQGE